MKYLVVMSQVTLREFLVEAEDEASARAIAEERNSDGDENTETLENSQIVRVEVGK